MNNNVVSHGYFYRNFSQSFERVAFFLVFVQRYLCYLARAHSSAQILYEIEVIQAELAISAHYKLC